MKSLALILALSCVSLVLAAVDDQTCKSDFQSFVRCMKDEHDKIPANEKTAHKKELKDKAEKCFSDASCDVPDWEADPFGGAGKNRPGGDSMPKAVKECLKRKMIEKIGAKLNGCLVKKGVSNVNFSALADSISSSGFDLEGPGGDEAKDDLHGGMKAKFNTVKAVDKCAQKKGGDTDSVKPLEQCLQKIKQDEKPKVCAKLITPCENRLPSAECKKRGEQVYKAMCECKQEKEAELSKKLNVLGKGQSKVGVQDVMKTMTEEQDMKDIGNQMDACYKEAGVEEPPIIKLVMKLMAGGGSGPMQGALNNAFSVSGSMVVVMSDMMALDAADENECKPCD